MQFVVAGVPVRIAPAFWVVTVIFASGRFERPAFLVSWIAVVFASVLVHELGHALTARRFGHDVRIELHGMGGTAYHQGGTLSPGRRLAIALAGPCAGVALGGLVWAFSRRFEGAEMASTVVADLLWVNWGYGLLNFLPIRPLDGSSAMDSLVTMVSGRERPRVTTAISLITTVGLVAFAVVERSRPALFLTLWLAVPQLSQLRRSFRESIDGERQAALDALAPALQERDGARLVAEAERVLAAAASDSVRAQAVHLASWGYLFQDDLAGAARTLMKMPAGFTLEKHIVARIAQARPVPEEAVHLLSRVWHEEPDATGALLLVSVWVAEGHVDRAEEWALSVTENVDARVLAKVEEARFRAGDYAAALRLSRVIVERFRRPAGAYNAACSLARMGRAGEALDALDQAVALGWKDGEAAAADPDLASLAGEERFVALVARLRQEAAG
jgi:Zn-dependent protease